MFYLFYILVIEQILQGLYNLWDTLRWYQTARKRAMSHQGFYAPSVAVFCPLKGTEPGLELNLEALTRFDYPNYEIFFSLAELGDPARKIAERIATASKHPAHVIVAGHPSNCSEKVNNLRVAIEQAGSKFDAYVFCDSDGRPGRAWLSKLVAPLADAKTGAATTFRWYLPQIGGMWSALASAWNAPLATYLGPRNRNCCWGGGTAIRREVFEAIRADEAWRTAASDDLSLTLLLRSNNLAIDFVPECLVPSVMDMKAAAFFEFTERQVILLRVYAPKVWARALFAHLIYVAMLVSGIALAAADWFTGTPAFQVVLLLLTPPLLAILRGVLRLMAVTELLPEWKEQLLARGWIWTLLAPVVPLFSLWNHLMAAFTRRISWRGARYELVSPTQTRILAR
jgi:cellulose synthase/poly-beta-1,6-N-acetylglucosamine synthase-like glycosyltransferase